MADRYALTPDLFSKEAISEETAFINDQVEKQMAQATPAHKVHPRVIRENAEAGRGLLGTPIRTVDAARNRIIDGPAGKLGIRVMVPEEGEVRGVYYHIHGGGFVIGAPHHSDVRNWQVARHCGLAVVSVDYRLAPEDPYPAGPDDCEAAALWVARNAKSEFGSDVVFVGGESAGANLAAVTALRMRDRHGYRFAGSNLVFGWYDVALSPSARNWGDRELILSTPGLKSMADHYVAEERRRDPDVSPVYADLGDLGPAIFTVGTLDPLLDDTLFMHARWVACGNEAELAVYPGGIHAFNAFPCALQRESHTRIESFLSGLLDRRGEGGS